MLLLNSAVSLAGSQRCYKNQLNTQDNIYCRYTVKDTVDYIIKCPSAGFQGRKFSQASVPINVKLLIIMCYIMDCESSFF